MSDLRLRRFDEQPTDAIPFPRSFEPAPQPRLAPGAGEPDFEPPVDSLELASHIKASLDQLQRRLDRVKDELEDVYRFPTPDDWTPPPAA